MRRFFSSLVFKISFTIIIIETIALTILGIYYVDRFGNQIDEQVKAKVSIPGTLMNQRALNYDSVQDRNSMQRLIGEEVVEAIILRRDGQVFYASHRDHEGKQAEVVLKDIDFSKFDSETPANRTRQFTRDGKVYFANATPIFSNKKLIGYLYLKIDASNSEKEKKNIARLFTIGSLLCILLTTFALIALIHSLTGPRISKILSCLQGVRDGNLQSRVAAIESLDEIGELGRSVNAMIMEIENRTTERDTAERTLRESEKKYRQLVENARDVIVIAQDGMIKFSNKRTSEFLEYEREELYSTPFLEFIHPDDRDVVADRQIRWVGGEANLPSIFSFRILTKSGQERHVQINTALVEWENRPSTLNFIRDISKQLELESQLQQAQKMEAIGTLAGGIAHDFNNILSAILGYSELALADLSSDSSMRSKLEAIQSSGKRARDLVAQILAFSRKDDQVRIPVAMHLVIEDALKLLRPAIPKTIDIQTQVASKCHVLGDPSRIHQIIMNLSTNAYQAMLETGGTLKISLSQSKIEGQLASVAQLPNGPYSKLVISDTGVGIPPEIVERIFDPYFTTKEKGKGTGLGLAAVHGIVKSHGGTILVKSENGEGTIFEVYLPLTVDRSDTKEQIDFHMVGGNERILLIDDEYDILEVHKELLEKYGYFITVKDNAQEALKLFSEKPKVFDLIITDMTMPNLTGTKLAVELKKIRSDIPIILCTGFSELVSKEKAEAQGIDGFLMKPVKMKDLLHMIRDLVDPR